METINRYLFEALDRFADRPMQIRRDTTLTYRDAARGIHGVATHLKEKGIQPGDRVALIAENSLRWLHTFLGILAAEAVVVPRGEDTAASDLAYILEHAEAKLVFAGSKKVMAQLPGGDDAILIDGNDFPAPRDLDANTNTHYGEARKEEDIAVILYTSGTTGQPKGVVMEQRNIAHNIRVLPQLVDIQPGDVWVSILPPWHTFELTAELTAFARGSLMVYTDRRRLKADLRNHKPQFFASVPRIWETIWDGATSAIARSGPVRKKLFDFCYAGSRMVKKGNPLGYPGHLLGKALFYPGIQATTGGRLKSAISGGGYLPPHIDEFFDIVGVPLLIGYGLTETAPVIALRRPEDNVLGTIGRAAPETELRLSKEGTVQARGPQIMRGYYRNDELTKQVIDEDGWFDTGDIARMTEKGDLIFVGRAKETIVLSGGENIEPEPIENRIKESALIDQVMLVGQDRKIIGALIVPAEGLEERPELEEKLKEVLKRRTGKAGGFRSFENVTRFAIVDAPFTPENGLLTQTLKLKRNVIAEQYADLIDSIYR